MVDAIVLDKKKILPCIAYLEGEYGINGVYAGVPVQLGTIGIERIIKLDLNADELTLLRKSGDAVRALNQVMGI
jgi:malate dehydrogenase